MKKINYRIVGFLMAVAAAVAVGGAGIWMYYDSGGESGAAIIGDFPVADSSTAGGVVASGDVSQGVAVDGDDDSMTTAPVAAVTSADSDAALDNSSLSVTNIESASDTASEPALSEAPSAAAANTVSPTADAPQKCTFSNIASAPATPGNIILNEIAWMGSLPAAGETASKASNREWIELKNISTSPVDVAGWQVVDATGNLKVTIEGTSTIVTPGGFYLLVRDGQSLGAPPDSGFGAPVVTADAGYAGSLPNTGDTLALVNPGCNVEDFLDASVGWPGGNATTKQTLERDATGAGGAANASANSLGWHTSAAPGGTPRAENSTPATYLISVSFTGNGGGTVSGGVAMSAITCGFTCQASYTEGTKLTLTATPNAGSIFNGWSGACAAKNNNQPPPTCSFVVSSSIALIADFEQVPTTPLVPTDVSSKTQTTGVTSSTASSTDSLPAASMHLLIAAIQIAGASSSNDFVKIFNPSGAAVDISGWKLHKKSSTGTDYSLKAFANGSTVAPGGYYVWANVEGGFADSIGAQASSTETLSADNSVALFDANGDMVDQVAWGTGTDQYVEGGAFPTDPAAGQVLARKMAGGGATGALVDTDDNASDFTLE